MLNTLALEGELVAAIEPVYGSVEHLMRWAQARRHQVRIVEIGERRARMSGTGIERDVRPRFKLRQVRAWARTRGAPN